MNKHYFHHHKTIWSEPAGSAETNLARLAGLLLCLVWFIAVLWVPVSSAAIVVPDPGPGFYVLDQANVMSETTKSTIIQTSGELHRSTKAQVAVVTLKSLDEQPLEDVSLAILRQWKLGDKELNNGVLILLVPSEHRSRIEVGYGLEGALTDAKTGRIQDEYMLPDFKQGNYDAGLLNGYAAVVNEAAKEYGVTLNIQPGTKAVPADQPVEKETPAWVIVLGVIGLLSLAWVDHRFFNGLIFGILLNSLFRGRSGGGGFGGGSGGGFGGGGSGGGGGSSRGW